MATKVTELNLSALFYANGFTLWHYKATDTTTEIQTAGYFNGVYYRMAVGDFILTNADTDGTPANKIYVVTAISGGAVTVSALV